jgi:long-chain acyl-CoA synthetase
VNEGLDLAAHHLVAPPTRPAIPGGGPQTTAEILDPVLALSPEREALVGRHGRYTYAELDLEVNRAAATLAGFGVGAGDRVAATLPNDTDIVVAFLATQRLGAIWVGINRPLAPREKAWVLRDSGAHVYLVDPPTREQMVRSGEVAEALEQMVVVAPGDVAADQWRAALARHADAPSRPQVSIDPFAPAAIAYTSGTTGFPKGAVHSQHNMLMPGAVAAGEGSYPRGQRHGVLLPLTILNLVVLVPLLAFQIHGTCVCMDRLDAQGIAEWVREERIGHFAAVPTIYYDLLTNPAVRAADLGSLVRPEVGGAECPQEFLRLYRERFGAEVSIGYGMTEAPTAVTRSSGERPPVAGLCGRALAHLRITIRDEEGLELPIGKIGEICVEAATSGPWAGVYTPMLGYWNRPDETVRALRDGVYRTGDMGELDVAGDLYIRGRRNDLILRGGANVYPAEIERVLQADERVAACAVFGVADERLGERVVAAIQRTATCGPLADEELTAQLRQRCGEELARYKIPEQFFFVEDIPRNAMGKIVKHELRARLLPLPA